MKTLLTLFFALLLLTFAWCQDTRAAEEAIGRIINTGLFEGHDNKVIGGNSYRTLTRADTQFRV
jgi:hypothetical protein